MNDINELARKAREQLLQQQKEDNPNDMNNMYDDLEKAQNLEDKSKITQEETPIYSADDYTIQNEVNNIDEYNVSNQQINQQEYPDLDQYDEPIFPNGPLQSQINSWKKQYPFPYDLFIIEVMEQYFICRTLNRFEYKQIITLENTDALIREEIMCKTCTLWPENFTWKDMAKGKAGIPSLLAENIMERSGLTNNFSIQVL